MIDFVEMLNSRSKVPLYQQLYEALAKAIQEGTLQAGEKLPGKRSMGGQLGVSVNTVDTAYQLLTAEGYLESRPRSGFYVAQVQQLEQCPVLPVENPPPLPEEPRFNLSTGSIDNSLFPFRTWGRIQKELLYSRPQLLSQGVGQGDFSLREALAQHLAQYRGVRCSPQQIVVGAGIEYLLGLLVPLLGDTIAIENPGYPRAKKVIANGGASCLPIAVDGQGLSVEELNQKDPQAVYVTPSHQFPTGVTMPVGRRTALLGWAYQKPHRLIVEDDYDSEFRFDLRPLPSLQGMDQQGRVVYISTFSKSLAPSIRIACMVLPPCLQQKWNQRYGGYASTVSRFEQQTLCRFIQEGHFSRHLARLRNRYRKRMEQLYHELTMRLGKKVKISGSHTGLHFLLTFPCCNEQELIEAAKQQGISVTGLSQYSIGSPKEKRAVILVGYGGLPEEQIPAAAQSLQQAWSKFL